MWQKSFDISFLLFQIVLEMNTRKNGRKRKKQNPVEIIEEVHQDMTLIITHIHLLQQFLKYKMPCTYTSAFSYSVEHSAEC